MTTPNEVIPYQDRANQQSVEAVNSLLTEAMTRINRGMDRAKEGTEKWIEAVNEIRSAGENVSLAEDHGQKVMRLYFASVATQSDWEVATLSKQRFQAALAIYKMMPKPAKTFAECKFAVQTVLQLTGDTAHPTRQQKQLSHSRNPWNEFVSDLASVESLVNELTKETPLDEWDKERLRKFVRATDELARKHDIAMNLL
jgi:hypothetical protein